MKLVNAAHRVIKEVDPEIRVIACSTAGVDLKFIDMCIAKGMAYDDISIHTYRGDPEELTFLADLAAVTNRAHGNPTWITEMGWPTGCGNGTVSEREQAGKYARAYMTAAGSGMIHSIYGYDFVDDGFNVLERENNFGIVRRDLTPKPAYRALAKVCRTFGSGTPALESVELPNGKAWIFRMGGRSAVWATRTARLVVQTDSPAEATNLMDEKLGGGQIRPRVHDGGRQRDDPFDLRLRLRGRRLQRAGTREQLRHRAPRPHAQTGLSRPRQGLPHLRQRHARP